MICSISLTTCFKVFTFSFFCRYHQINRLLQFPPLESKTLDLSFLYFFEGNCSDIFSTVNELFKLSNFDLVLIFFILFSGLCWHQYYNICDGGISHHTLIARIKQKQKNGTTNNNFSGPMWKQLLD
jgi:hypothetical protein